MTVEHGLTEAELAALSPEERAAVTADLSEHEASRAPAPEGDDDPAPEAPAAKAPDPVLGGAVKVETEPEAPAPDGDPGENDRDSEPEPLVVPYQAPAVQADKVKEVLSSLNKQFEDGELTHSEYLEKRDEVVKAVTKAELAAEHSYQVDEALWKRDVGDFLDAHEAYRKDKLLFNVFDSEVKRLAEIPENQNWTNKRLLEEAHKEIAARFKVDAAAPKAPADGKAELERRRRADFSGVPSTLTGVPSAGDSDASSGEFDAIERAFSEGRQADGERLLARLTPEQQDRYAMGAA